MSQNRINQRIASQPFTVETTRARQTARPTSPFKQVLVTGANVLLSGAEVATSAVGLPTLSAAISRARVGQGTGQIGSLTQAIENAADSSAAATGTPTTATGTLDWQAFQQQRINDDMELLQMQAQIQSYDRQITLASNVLKAKHETKKAAINNIRS